MRTVFFRLEETSAELKASLLSLVYKVTIKRLRTSSHTDISSSYRTLSAIVASNNSLGNIIILTRKADRHVKETDTGQAVLGTESQGILMFTNTSHWSFIPS